MALPSRASRNPRPLTTSPPATSHPGTRLDPRRVAGRGRTGLSSASSRSTSLAAHVSGGPGDQLHRRFAPDNPANSGEGEKSFTGGALKFHCFAGKGGGGAESCKMTRAHEHGDGGNRQVWRRAKARRSARSAKTVFFTRTCFARWTCRSPAPPFRPAELGLAPERQMASAGSGDRAHARRVRSAHSEPRAAG